MNPDPAPTRQTFDQIMARTEQRLQETHQRCRTTHLRCHTTKAHLQATRTRMIRTEQLLHDLKHHIDRVQHTLQSGPFTFQNA
ncbi:MAG TPA: hypothetical protein VGD69_21095 [Herpetosiphonaceae bacterium]